MALRTCLSNFPKLGNNLETSSLQRNGKVNGTVYGYIHKHRVKFSAYLLRAYLQGTQILKYSLFKF